MQFTFVILNYNTFDDTKKCIESIRSLNLNTNINYNIIVVDNASTDNSGKKIKEKFNQQDIETILLEQNVGFSKGNNIGYKEAVRRYKSDFIILLNSDTEIPENDFYKIIMKRFKNVGFGVLGPNVYNPITNTNQSPFYENKNIDINFVNKQIFKNKIHLVRINIQRRIPTFTNYIYKIIKRQKKGNNLFKESNNDACIHGCFMVFSRNFINIFPDGLYDKTFMYGEEDILYYLCKKNNIIEYYDSKLKIYHYEEKSSKNSFSDQYEAQKFKYNNLLKSLSILKELVTSYDGR